MAICHGCGAALAGTACTACGTRAGDRFRERVVVPVGTPLPPACCCCLGPADDLLQLERANAIGTRISALPACRSCVRGNRTARHVFHATWLVGMVGLVVLFLLVRPRAVPEAAGLALIPIAYLATAWLMPRLWSSTLGHVPRCDAAALGRRGRGHEVHLVLGNRAYARLLEHTAAHAAAARRR